MDTSQKYERIDKREQVQRNIPAETHSDEMQAEKKSGKCMYKIINNHYNEHKKFKQKNQNEIQAF